MKLWIGAGLIIIGGIYIGGTLIQNEIEQTKQDNAIAICLNSQDGRDYTSDPWRVLKNRPVSEAVSETGATDSQLRECYIKAGVRTQWDD